MNQKTIQQVCPNFWNWLKKATKPREGTKYKIGYLKNNVSRALCIRLPQEGFYTHIFDNLFNITDIVEFDKKFDALQNLPGFKRYVRQTCHNDVTAALNLYRRYLVYLNGPSEYLKIDESIESNLEDPQNWIKLNPDQLKKFREKKPLPRPKLRKINEKYTYPRVAQLVQIALSDSKYECIINSAHDTFINRKTHKKYLEVHHLIPLGAQKDFENRLDVLSNMVCLCPNCHMRLHHGIGIEEILRPIYNSRINDLKECGLYVSFEKLLSYYLG